MLNKRVNYTSFKTIVTKMPCVTSIPPNVLPPLVCKKLPIELLIILSNFIRFKPRNKAELQDAVDMWCENRKEAIKEYGHISGWDTSMITDMSELFKD